MTSDTPPGFRFYPTEEELICFYLRNKLDGVRRDDIERVIPVVDVFSVDPCQLSEMHSRTCAAEGEPWFYFCRLQDKEARGGRPNRTTPSGYWKAAGTPGVVYSAEHRPIGVKKTMVFYRGRAGSGTKTEWKMNEYKAFQDAATAGAVGCLSSTSSHATATPNPPPPQTRSEFTLCRLYIKSGCLRQFDRRPRTASRGAAGDNPGPSTAAAPASGEGGSKRKRSGSNDDDDTSSNNDGGSGGSGQQQQQPPSPMETGSTDSYMDHDVPSWDNSFDWP